MTPFFDIDPESTWTAQKGANFHLMLKVRCERNRTFFASDAYVYERNRTFFVSYVYVIEGDQNACFAFQPHERDVIVSTGNAAMQGFATVVGGVDVDWGSH